MRCALVCSMVTGCANLLGLEAIDPPDGPAGYSRAVLADHPAAYLPLDDNTDSATARDLVNGAPVGTIIGNVTLGDLPARPEFVSSMTFDGVSGAVDLLDVLPFDGKAHYSVEAWILPKYSANAFYTIVSKWHETNANGPASGWDLYYISPGNLPAQIAFSREPVQKVVQGELPDGWHHVVGTFDGNTLFVYVDGRELNMTTATNPLDDQGLHLLIGAGDRPNNATAKGSIDQVAIYDYALTAEQVSAHFNAASQ